MNLLVTVYIPTHNRSKLLRRAIKSVLIQDYELIELIIVNDGSTDDTELVLDDYSDDSRVIIVNNLSPMGACYCRNVAIKMASGFFITGLDDDDFFLPGRIVDFVNFWDRSKSLGLNFSGIFTGALKFNRGISSLVNLSSVVALDDILTENLVGSQVFTRRDFFVDAGGFSDLLQAWQDWDAWVRLIRGFGPLLNTGRVSYVIDESHEYFRISNKSELVLREVFNNFCKINAPIKKWQISAILLSLRSYPQVRFSLQDYASMLNLFFRVDYLIKKIKRKYLFKVS